jgi:hypothetical protein
MSATTTGELAELTLTLLDKGDEKIMWAAFASTDLVAEVIPEEQRNRVVALKAAVMALALRFAPGDVVRAAFDDLYGDDDEPVLSLIQGGGVRDA